MRNIISQLPLLVMLGLSVSSVVAQAQISEQVINLNLQAVPNMLNRNGEIEIDLLAEARRQKLLAPSSLTNLDLARVAFEARTGIGGGRATLLINSQIPFTADFETEPLEMNDPMASWANVEIKNLERNVNRAQLRVEGEVRLKSLRLIMGQVQEPLIFGVYNGVTSPQPPPVSQSQTTPPQQVRPTVPPPAPMPAPMPAPAPMTPPPAPMPMTPPAPTAPQRLAPPMQLGPPQRIAPSGAPRANPAPAPMPMNPAPAPAPAPTPATPTAADCIRSGNYVYCVCDQVRNFYGTGLPGVIVAVNPRTNTYMIKFDHRSDLFETYPSDETRVVGRLVLMNRGNGRVCTRP